MPIFDDILSQPAILISLGLAFLFIVAAVVLAVLPRIKASRARAQRRKAAAQAVQAAAQETARLEAEAVAEATATRKGGKRRVAAPAAAEVDSAAVQAAKTKTPAAPVTPAAPPAAAAKAPAAPVVSAGSSTTTTKEDEVSPEMQDLLSSVFSDEDNSERQAILLKGIEPISADELLTLSKMVAAQLRGEQPSNIVHVKENELT